MIKRKAEYERYMDKKGIKYKAIDERALSVTYNTENPSDVTVVVIFDEKDNGDHVSLNVFDLGPKIPEKKRAAMLVCCNALNSDFRWCKFYLDSDSDLRVQMDAIVTEGNAGPVLVELVKRMVSISDDAYPRIMKTIFG